MLLARYAAVGSLLRKLAGNVSTQRLSRWLSCTLRHLDLQSGVWVTPARRALAAGHAEGGASCACGTRPRVGLATLSRMIDSVVGCRTQARHIAGFWIRCASQIVLQTKNPFGELIAAKGFCFSRSTVSQHCNCRRWESNPHEG